MVCGSCMVTPIGAASAVPSGLKVERIVSKIVPFEKPKSVNFTIKPAQTC